MTTVAPFLLGAIGLVLVLLLLRPPPVIFIVLLLVFFLPGRWWRWRTRRFRRGVKALKRGDSAEARAEFEAFVAEIEADDSFQRWQPIFNLGRSYSYPAAARSNIGVTWLHEGEAEKALGFFEAARRLDPESAQAAFGEAAARRRLGQLPAAEQAAQRAVDLRPRYLPGRLLLAAVRRERGDRGGAEEALRPLREKGQDPEELMERMLGQWPDANSNRTGVDRDV